MSASYRHLTPEQAQSGARRHYSQRLHCAIVSIQAGDCYVTDENEVITTVLGSCIAACIRDTRLEVGGMNHFMLPATADSLDGENVGYAMRYGVFAMEYLVNEILRRGGRRETLEVKLFGGANVVKALSDVGERNIRFVREFLSAEGYRIAAEDLGEGVPRRVKYSPMTGRAMVKRLQRSATAHIADREQTHLRRIRSAPGEVALTDVELF